MKRNGFTLIEILVSIVLVSIILVSILGTLVKLKDVYGLIHEDVEIKIHGSAAIKVISNDINEHWGISSMNCDNENHCSLVLGDGEIRQLLLVTKEYNDDTKPATNPITGITSKNTYTRSTLFYIDSVLDDVSSISTDKYLLIKSFTSRTSVNVSDSSKKDTKQYHLQKINYSVKQFDRDAVGDKLNKMYIINIISSDPNHVYDLHIYGLSL